jgi:hypothetical protein
VAVEIERDGDRRVPEDLAHDLGMLAGTERERGPGMPKSVELEGADVGGRDEALERPGERGRMETVTILPAKDEVEVGVVGAEQEAFLELSRPVRLERRHNLGGQGNGAPTARRLRLRPRRYALDEDQGLADRCTARLKVDVAQ